VGEPVHFLSLVCRLSRQRTGSLAAEPALSKVSLEKAENPYSSFSSFPNQFSSRQRRRAMRARCNITQRLPSEMLSSEQISLLSNPSTSRKQKAALMFLGSLAAQA